MLSEIRDVKQNEGEDRRRWFTDDYWDLYVWINDDGGLSGFQLCYEKAYNEHALTWRQGAGFSHTRIDDGEQVASSHMTPMLVRDGFFDKDSIARRFKADSSHIDQSIVAFVLKKLAQFPS